MENVPEEKELTSTPEKLSRETSSNLFFYKPRPNGFLDVLKDRGGKGPPQSVDVQPSYYRDLIKVAPSPS